jgi:phosphatidylglycerophosphatase A
MVIGIVIALVEKHRIPVALALITLCREFLVTACAWWRPRRASSSPRQRRQVKTVTQLIALGLLPRRPDGLPGRALPAALGRLGLREPRPTGGLHHLHRRHVLSVWSGYRYISRNSAWCSATTSRGMKLEQPAMDQVPPHRDRGRAGATLGPLGSACSRRRAPGVPLAGVLYFALCFATWGSPATWSQRDRRPTSRWVSAARRRMRLGRRDPGEVILDEFVAMPLCFLGWQWIPAGPLPFLGPVSFLCWRASRSSASTTSQAPRIIDSLQELPGGWGVVAGRHGGRARDVRDAPPRPRPLGLVCLPAPASRIQGSACRLSTGHLHQDALAQHVDRDHDPRGIGGIVHKALQPVERRPRPRGRGGPGEQRHAPSARTPEATWP